MTRLDYTEQSFRDAKNHLYGLAHNVCVNGKEQNALLHAMGQTELRLYEEGASGLAVISILMGIITDGLRYGNWPWIQNGVNTLESSTK